MIYIFVFHLHFQGCDRYTLKNPVNKLDDVSKFVNRFNLASVFWTF